MFFRSKYALIGALVVLVAGGFLWRFGDSTGGVDDATAEGEKILGGWQEVEDVPLPAVSKSLPGIKGASAGIPSEGTYLVNLWASYCAPCRHEMPWLEKLSTDGDIDVLGITRDNLLPEALEAMRQRKVTYPNVRDEFGDFMFAIRDVLPPQQLPSSFLVVDGRITWSHVGPFRSYADLRDSVRARL